MTDFDIESAEPRYLPERPRDVRQMPVGRSLTCVACGNPTLMADFQMGTATCKLCHRKAEEEFDRLIRFGSHT